MSDFILTPAPGSRSTCALGPFPDATAAEKYAIEHRLVGHYRPFPLCLVGQPEPVSEVAPWLNAQCIHREACS